jgi:hypothetical protein
VSISGCKNTEKTVINNYYLSLTGESETWEVKSYKVEITPEVFNAGNGTLIMKSPAKYNTDFLSIKVFAVIDNEDTVIQAKQVKGSGIELTQLNTGAIKGGTYLDENGKAITLENISHIYMIVEWQDVIKDKRMKEKIELFNQDTLFNGCFC